MSRIQTQLAEVSDRPLLLMWGPASVGCVTLRPVAPCRDALRPIELSDPCPLEKALCLDDAPSDRKRTEVRNPISFIAPETPSGRLLVRVTHVLGGSRTLVRCGDFGEARYRVRDLIRREILLSLRIVGHEIPIGLEDGLCFHQIFVGRDRAPGRGVRVVSSGSVGLVLS